jgi:bacterioferritin-associated ferredoxin
MFVCLCVGVTNQQVANAVHSGARTSKQVATACGAGSDCGRCRRTLRAIIASTEVTTESHRGRVRPRRQDELPCAPSQLR